MAKPKSDLGGVLATVNEDGSFEDTVLADIASIQKALSDARSSLSRLALKLGHEL